MGAITVSTVSTRALLRYGMDRDLVFEACPAAFAERMTAESMMKTWRAIAAVAGDDSIGVRVARHVRCGAYGSLDVLFAASESTRAAFRGIARYFPLGNGGAELRLQRLRGATAIELQHAADTPPDHVPHSVGYTLAFLLLRSRTATATAWKPLEVHFTFARPRDVSELKRVFGSSLHFERRTNRLLIDDSVMRLPHVTVDAPLRERAEEQAARSLAGVSVADRFVDVCRSAVRETLAGGECSLVGISRAMTVSVRTLQRRLAGSGTSLRDLVEEARRDEAATRLVRGDDTVEIAEALGFSEPSAFFRAFRRWTGTTPAQFRTAGGLEVGASGQ